MVLGRLPGVAWFTLNSQFTGLFQRRVTTDLLRGTWQTSGHPWEQTLKSFPWLRWGAGPQRFNKIKFTILCPRLYFKPQTRMLPLLSKLKWKKENIFPTLTGLKLWISNIPHYFRELALYRGDQNIFVECYWTFIPWEIETIQKFLSFHKYNYEVK